ncbi:MAG: restriction endonuclease subunit S [Clostridium butyricum]|nr:restriction endonuclease subunit S [Clostridium butyricum]MDU5821337.1 restriction endonuclease subunit S [Clostridium butyricum]
MENNWDKTTFQNIITLNYGKSLPKTKRIQGKYSVYGSGGIVGTHNELLVDGPVIIVGRKGTVGSLFYETKGCFPIDTTYYIKQSSKYNLKFIYYLLRCSNIDKMNSHSAVPGLNRNDLYSKEVIIPTIDTQDKIVKILYSLDNKIKLNNKMNKTLEEMAQAIFKSWFVDFEPFKNGEFEESEVGMIPKGWRTVELSEIGNIITGKTPSKNNLEFFGDEYKFITPKDINGNMFITKTERGLSEQGYNKMKKNKHIKYSIGVSCIGSDLGEVYLNDNDGFTNQQINTITLSNIMQYPYVYIFLKNMKNELKNIASGSAVPIINKTTFSKIKIILPSEKCIGDFYNKVNSIFDKVLINISQNEELKAIRDTLLPKLISGEIKL